MTEPRIRPAGPGDGPGCAEIWVDIGRYYYELDPRAFQNPDPAGLAESFERDIADHDPGRLYLVAEVDELVAGFLVAVLQQPGPHPEHELIRDLSRPRVFVQILAVATPQPATRRGHGPHDRGRDVGVRPRRRDDLAPDLPP